MLFADFQMLHAVEMRTPLKQLHFTSRGNGPPESRYSGVLEPQEQIAPGKILLLGEIQG
jgi:hypothetical protein